MRLCHYFHHWPNFLYIENCCRLCASSERSWSNQTKFSSTKIEGRNGILILYDFLIHPITMSITAWWLAIFQFHDTILSWRFLHTHFTILKLHYVHSSTMYWFIIFDIWFTILPFRIYSILLWKLINIPRSLLYFCFHIYVTGNTVRTIQHYFKSMKYIFFVV